MRQLLTIMLSLPLVAIIGCADNKYSYGGGSDTGAEGSETTDSTGAGPGGEDTASSVDSNDTARELPPAVWYALDAQLNILDGALVDGSFEVRISGEDTLAEPNCSAIRSLESAVALEVLPDPVIYHWWSVEVAEDDGSCGGADALPTSFLIGLGAMHPDVVSALTRDGLDVSELEARLYGVYASVDGGAAGDFCGGGGSSDACVYGYAGTPDAFAGESSSVSAPPIPDGTYGVTAAYYFPIE